MLLKEVDEVLEVDVNPIIDDRGTACMIDNDSADVG